jgi:hypothetical protein
MKLTKLPALNNKNYNYLSYVIGIVVILFFYISLIVPKQDTSVLIKHTEMSQTAKSVLVTTKNIIIRDGNIPHDVADKYTYMIFEAADKHKIDPVLILSVMFVESRFKSDAVSSAKAIGLMQVIHKWHPEKSTQANLFHPENNINVGTKILADYTKRSKSETETLLRYNGTLGKSNKYAIKVLAKKQEYKNEIMKAVRNT